MKTIRLSHFILIIILLLQFSCKLKLSTQYSANDFTFEARQKYSADWLKTLEEGEYQVKKYWIDLLNERDWDWVKYYQTDLSEEDLPNIELIPTFVYKMDSIGWANFNVGSKVEKLIKIDTTRARYYVSNNEKYVALINPVYQNKVWKNGYGFSGIPPKMALKLDSIFSKDGEVFDVIISVSINKRYQFLCFYDGKEIMCIKEYGQIMLMKEELIKLKKI